MVPPVKLEKSESGFLSSAWNYVSQMPYFNNEEMNDNKDFGFPDYFGKGKAAVCGNAGPKQDVLRVLESIPSSYLVLEHIDDRDRMTRLYIDKSKKKNPIILYFFGGLGGNDLVVALFEHGNLTKIDKMIKEENAKKEEDKRLYGNYTLDRSEYIAPNDVIGEVLDQYYKGQRDKINLVWGSTILVTYSGNSEMVAGQSLLI